MRRVVGWGGGEGGAVKGVGRVAKWDSGYTWFDFDLGNILREGQFLIPS